MSIDPLEAQLDLELEAQLHNEDVAHNDTISTIETTEEWSTWRENLATQMWNEWVATRNMN